MNLARHYRTLGLRRGASSGEVKAAYRSLVRQYHPDINPDETAVEQFIKINDAYTILTESLIASRRPTAQNRPTEQSRPTEQRHSTEQRYSTERKQANQEPTHQAPARSAPPPNPTKPESGSTDSFENRLQDIRITLERLGFNSFRDDAAAHMQPEAAVGDRAQALTEQALTEQALTEETTAREISLKQEAYQQLKDLLKQQKFPRAIALVEGLAHRMPADREIIQWQAIVYQRWGRRLVEDGQPRKARIYLKKALRTDPNNRALWREINRDFGQIANANGPL